MYILLIVSILLGVIKSAVYNNFAKKSKPDRKNIFKYNATSYGIAAIIALCFGFETSVSSITIILAAIYAVIVSSLQGLSVYAMKIGPMSTTALLVLYGMIIPAIAGPVFWGEKFGVWQGVGISLILISMWMLRKEEENRKTADKKWSMVAGVLFLLSGLAGLMEKIHQSTDGASEKNMFIFVAYIIMFVISVCGMLLKRKNSSETVPVKTLTLTGGISGIIIALYALTNLTLAGKLDTMIYYPVSNGGALILTVVISVAVFHEKCTTKQIIGFIIGLLSVCILSLPI